MQILYIGELKHGATAAMRLKSLNQLGYLVQSIDSSYDLPSNATLKLLGRCAWKLGWPIDFQGLNDLLLVTVKTKQIDLVWIDKGIAVSVSTLQEIKRKNPRIIIAHYNPDDPFGSAGKSGWRRFIRSIPEYDVHFVPRAENLVEYQQVGAKIVYHNVPTRGFDPEIHRPYDSDDAIVNNFRCDVGFIGEYERDRYEQMRQLADAGFTIRLAYDWPKQHWHHRFLRAPMVARGQNYGKSLSSLKIGLGFLRKVNRDRHTSRSIEIPGCGTFLLAERTDEHQELFLEGVEAEFFGSPEELVEKTKYYLSNDTEREKIAAAGRARCIRSGYDYNSRMKKMLDQAVTASHESN